MSVRFRAFQHRNYQLFFAGQFVSLIGTWMQSTAQLWLVYKLTGSAALLGLFGFANQIPILLLSAAGGYVADHYDRHRAVIWTQVAALALAFALAGLTLTHHVRVWQIIVIAFLVGIVNSFEFPIRQAFIIQMVGKADLPNAIALNGSMVNSARVVGPALAGFAIAWIGEGWCFLLNGVSFLAVIGALLAMQLAPAMPNPGAGSALETFLEGLRFVKDNRAVRSALLLLSMFSLLGLQYSVFMPIFATEILHGGARSMGFLLGSAGVGAVLGALHFAARTTYKNLERFIAMTSVISAAGVVVFSQSRIFLLSAGALFVIGGAVTAQVAATNTIVQSRVPDQLRGRVMAVYASMFMGVQPIGALFAGLVARHIGAPRTLAIFGTMCLAGAVVFIFRVLLRLDRAGTPAA